MWHQPYQHCGYLKTHYKKLFTPGESHASAKSLLEIGGTTLYKININDRKNNESRPAQINRSDLVSYVQSTITVNKAIGGIINQGQPKLIGGIISQGQSKSVGGIMAAQSNRRNNKSGPTQSNRRNNKSWPTQSNRRNNKSWPTQSSRRDNKSWPTQSNRRDNKSRPTQSSRRDNKTRRIIGGGCHLYHFCRDQTRLFPRQNTSFVATKVCLSRQNYVVVKKYLSRQT